MKWEHGGACVHPMLGKPMRAAIGGGKAVIGSNVKVAAAGALLDVPLGHKDDSRSFPHFDTITVSVADAPRPDEILVVMAIADWRAVAESVRYRTDPVGLSSEAGTRPMWPVYCRLATTETRKAGTTRLFSANCRRLLAWRYRQRIHSSKRWLCLPALRRRSRQ